MRDAVDNECGACARACVRVPECAFVLVARGPEAFMLAARARGEKSRRPAVLTGWVKLGTANTAIVKHFSCAGFIELCVQFVVVYPQRVASMTGYG